MHLEEIIISNSDGDNCFSIRGNIVLVRNILRHTENQAVHIVSLRFEKVENFYQYPLCSSELGIYLVWFVRAIIQCSPFKCYIKICLMSKKRAFVAIPMHGAKCTKVILSNTWMYTLDSWAHSYFCHGFRQHVVLVETYRNFRYRCTGGSFCLGHPIQPWSSEPVLKPWNLNEAAWSRPLFTYQLYILCNVKTRNNEITTPHRYEL